MALWLCNSCGNAEDLQFQPDCCSLCSGTMETQDGRSTYPLTDNRHGPDALTRCAADEGDPASIIELWHAGIDLSVRQLEVLHEIMLGNRVDLISRSYEFVGRAAA
ncbi:hypothetical protein ASC97_05785 [Rhizobium sp. Root1203]|uniref:hypothetical protein n=1 Tax=Rhizobium sp. Root1203 TaxID=1736427 RepID=UPI00070BD697|nr:hypothetical protein [Rhizobium sp. Root1203]KQV27872.1 hypothetical protein ASC97_05785 [Rhizobium sp. Root1203]